MRFIATWLLPGVLGFVILACSGKVQTPSGGDGSGSGMGGDPSGDQADPPRDAGVAQALDATIPEAPQTRVPVCYNAQDCNDDPAISALHGTCTFGLCICKQGFHVQPNGRCGKAVPSCAGQQGTCVNAAACPAGSLAGTSELNMQCGDFVAAVCCTNASTCQAGAVEAAGAGWASVDFHCCANKVSSDPICVNRYQTCRPGEIAQQKRFPCP